MLKGVLIRLQEDDKQTLGSFILHDDTDMVFSAKSLELPWLDNARNVSCIPAGRYVCRRRYSDKYGHHFKITEKHGGEVRDREFILIHFGNFKDQTEGCVLLGRDHVDINGDGYLDVTSSKATMKQLNREVDDVCFPLEVIDMTRGYKIK